MAAFGEQPWLGFMFDIETGGLERKRTYDAFSPDAIQQFFAASRRPDFASSNYFLSTVDQKTGKPFQLLELYADNGLLEHIEQPEWRGFHPGDGLYVHPQEGFEVSKFAQEHEITRRAQEQGIFNAAANRFLTEEEAARSFYGALEKEIQAAGRADLVAWHGIFDMVNMESIAHRYDSLKEYRGWFARKTEEGVFQFHSAEDELFKLAWKYGEENPEFAKSRFLQKDTGKLARNWKDLREVPGWNVDNTTAAFGGKAAWFTDGKKAHSAAGDVPVERGLFEKFRESNRYIGEGESVEQSLRRSGLISGEQTAEKAFTQVFNTPWSRQVEREAAAGAKLLHGSEVAAHFRQVSIKTPLVLAGIAAGVAASAGLAFGNRRDRQTQITGFLEGGKTADLRHEMTDFGSGWRGLNEDSRNQKAFYTLGTAGALYGVHRLAYSNIDGYGTGVFNLISQVEKRFPGQIISTLGLSQYSSQYLAKELEITGRQIGTVTGQGFQLNEQMGSHLQRLIGDKTDLTKLNWSDPNLKLKFLRENPSSPYMRMHLADANGERATEHLVSFAKKGNLTGSSSRYGATLFDAPESFRKPAGANPLEAFQGWYDHRKKSQQLSPYSASIKYTHGSEVLDLQPFLAKTEGQAFRNLSQKVGQTTFGWSERINHLMGGIGLGIRRGSYNSTAGLVGQLLTKRALPAWAGLTAAGYADYLTGHKASNTVWGLWAKGRIAHAEATDTTPGLRSATDFFHQYVGDNWYAPLAVPVGTAAVGGLVHTAKVLSGQKWSTVAARKAAFKGTALKGGLVGLAAILPLIPGMLGSKETATELRDMYSGRKPVEVRAGRWWEIGATAFQGNRILMHRPHAYVLHKTRAEDISVYGSEKEKWAHNPLVSPLQWLKDPNWLEKKHAQDRPYPVWSPAFADVPFIGPMLAATVGKVFKPPKRVGSEEWDGSDYILYNKSIEPKSPRALAPMRPTDEFSLKAVAEKEIGMFTEFIGLPGFLLRSAWNVAARKDETPDVHYQGSRQMTSASRRYYEKELGAMAGFTPEGDFTGFSEPIRRFIQRDDEVQANELKNQMPSWLPNGDEYFHDFHKGDPYSSLPMGFARLPGAGYEALHPEVKGLAPEDYPDIVKLRILGDVAPWSGHFKKMSAAVGAAAKDDVSLKIEYEEILQRNREMRESTIQTRDRHAGPTDEVEGTIKIADTTGFELNELPGRRFSYSSVGMSAAHLSSLSIGEDNQRNRDAIHSDVERRLQEQSQYLSEALAPGTSVRAIIPRGAADTSKSQAVVYSSNRNVNLELTNRGLAKLDLKDAGSEAQYMVERPLERALVKYAEGLGFAGDEAWYNPLRYMPKPFHSKFWNQRTAYEQYLNQEVYGSRMRRWDRPIHDMLAPYVQGAAYRLTGNVIISPEVQEKRDLDTLTDQLQYMRELQGTYTDPKHRGIHAMRVSQTAIGSNLFGSSDILPFTLSSRDRKYFSRLLKETDNEERGRILQGVSKEMGNALRAQWTKEVAKVARAEGQSVSRYEQSGRIVRKDDVAKLTTFKGKVKKVTDGDTIVVGSPDGDKTLRLSNINTPEMSTLYGPVSKEMTEKMVMGKEVSVHTVGNDKYGRTVSDVFLPDLSLLNYELLNSGAAKKDVYQNNDDTNQGLTAGDYFRAREIAEFFKRRGLKLPDEESEVMAADIDYQDVKLKIIQWEGLDHHDFNIYDDRADTLWRKPYLDGAVRELTSGDDRSVEEMQDAIERMIAASKSKDPKARSRITTNASMRNNRNVTVTVDTQPNEELRQEVRRNADDYRE